MVEGCGSCWSFMFHFRSKFAGFLMAVYHSVFFLNAYKRVLLNEFIFPMSVHAGHAYVVIVMLSMCTQLFGISRSSACLPSGEVTFRTVVSQVFHTVSTSG